MEAFNVQAEIDLDLSFDCKCAGFHMWWTLTLVSFRIIKLTCKGHMTVTEPSYRKKLLSEVFQSSRPLCTCPSMHTHDTTHVSLWGMQPWPLPVYKWLLFPLEIANLVYLKCYLVYFKMCVIFSLEKILFYNELLLILSIWEQVLLYTILSIVLYIIELSSKY